MSTTSLPRLALVIVLAFAAAGCNWAGWAAHAVAGDQKKKVWHDAQYAGLQNKSVAVLVSADDHTLYRHPGAPLDICRAVSARLASDIAGVTVSDPKQVHDYQTRNSYWSTLPYRDLLTRLNVQRIVHVDLVQYTTHEPGNQHVWRGVAVANILVASAEADNPNDLVYSNTVKVVYPPDRAVGVLDADDQTIQLGLLTLLSQEVSNLFHGHTKAQEK